MSETIPELEAPEAILRKVQALIDKAQHPNTPEGERETCFAMADRISAKYAIDLAKLDARRSKDEREKPTAVKLSFPGSSWDSHLSQMLLSIANNSHVRVRRLTWQNDFMLVGFQSDVDYVQLVWMSVHLGFMSKMEPRWDTERTDDENIRALKEAGMKWALIAFCANEHGFVCTANDGKLKAAYRRQCKKEGVEPTSHAQRHAAFRASYAAYFSDIIQHRLLLMSEARKETSKSSGAELVLFDRHKTVDEEFYRMYPEVHPDAIRLRQEEIFKREQERRARLSPKERAEEDARQDRMNEQYSRQERLRQKRLYDHNGAVAGRQAGASVDLSAGRNGVGPNNTKQIG